MRDISPLPCSWKSTSSLDVAFMRGQEMLLSSNKGIWSNETLVGWFFDFVKKHQFREFENTNHLKQPQVS
jgi:hypothetical protein